MRFRIDVRKAELFDQQRIELRLERPNGHVAAVGAGVDVIEGRVVEHARARIHEPGGARRERDAAETRHHVDDGTVDDATFAAPPGGENRAHQSERQPKRAAAVADDRRRRDRRRVWAGGKRQRAAQRHIVEIVARGLRQRTVLPPAGHAAVDEPRIAPRAFGGAEAEALHDPRPIALDQRVSRLDEAQRLLDRFRALEVEGDHPLAAPKGLVGERASRIAEGRLVGANDCNHLGAEVGEHAAGERTWADAFELDDAQARKRTNHCRGPKRRIHVRLITSTARPRTETRRSLKLAPETAS